MILRLTLAALYFFFAAVQLNDPDPLAWMLLYGTTGVLFVVTNFRPLPPLLLQLGLVIILGWMLSLLPDFIHWVKMGMPTIVGTMKAEAPHVELTREFLGLLLAGLGWLFLWRRAPRPTY
ncbi:MAG: hypothetical protein DA408_08260 [Bacteroidetes bacterium]|nr:MAG: hypothetical protein C7N36_09090 [Bacteroidota bacterium]PTM13060.1 MAG: hypothetical protein DA408_08260 [Bacteroidota bacterium]